MFDTDNIMQWLFRLIQYTWCNINATSKTEITITRIFILSKSQHHLYVKCRCNVNNVSFIQ